MNESRDFVKIACVRSRDFSGPDQSSVTMADKVCLAVKYYIT